MFRQRLAQVEDRIEKAAARSGRLRRDVTLIAVTKTFPAVSIIEAYEAGLRDFGENYVQEFDQKLPLLSHLTEARFHLIGHLQSNKSRKASDLFQTIQTIDDQKLARRLNEHRTPDQVLDVMLEIKLAEEESKHGVAPEAAGALVDAVRSQPNLRLLGLMTIPPWTTDAEASRPYFVRLRELGEKLGTSALSMGMSNDFEVAIEEGATHIRVGTALFGSRKRP